MKIAHHMFKKSRWWNNKVNDIHNNTALRFAHTNKKNASYLKIVAIELLMETRIFQHGNYVTQLNISGVLFVDDTTQTSVDLD